MSKINVLVKHGSYRNEPVVNKVFELVEDYKMGAKGGWITVDGAPLGRRDKIRVRVEKKDYVLMDARGNEVAAVLTNDTPVMRPQETDQEIIERMNMRFQLLEDMTTAAANGEIKALIATGGPGIGKTFGVERKLNDFGLVDDLAGRPRKYQVVKGVLSALGLYMKLWDFRDPGSVVVFDDSDGVFHDEDMLNMLKAALDSKAERWLYYNKDSKTLNKADIPQKFKFEGSVIFITNKDFDHERSPKMRVHLDALQSRCHYLNLEVQTPREKMLRIESLMADGALLEGYHFDKKTEVAILDFVTKHKDEFRELSLRTVIKVADLVRSFPKNWEMVATTTVVGR